MDMGVGDRGPCPKGVQDSERGALGTKEIVPPISVPGDFHSSTCSGWGCPSQLEKH